MKNLLLGLIFISSSVAINAQETNNTPTNNQTKESISSNEVFSTKSSLTASSTERSTINIDKVCYGETSKIAFFEVLISQNNFKINLKNSTDLVIRNTEEIISKKRDEILYSEEE